MKDSLRAKLEHLSERLQELSILLAEPSVIAKQTQFREYSKEYAQLQPIVRSFDQFRQAERDTASTLDMLKDPDLDVRNMAQDELASSKALQDKIELELQRLMLPKDPHDDSNIFLEIRAGTGGDEASIFAGDLYRMYHRYAETRKWQIEVLNENPGEHGGYKEIICRIIGQGAYSRLKFESGAHRVQRVPETEAQGRIHTSACTVAILPEIDEVEQITINPADLRTDTYRSSGAGGQHVNKTDSAIRITHIPSGLVVECQEERSQHKNRARAMSLLQARLLAMEQEKQKKEQQQTRRLQVGTGDRSERIRTYNFPQGRLTDHRIGLTLYKLDQIIEGNLDPVIEPLIQEHQADQLAEMSEINT